jgi:hypothetical protein
LQFAVQQAVGLIEQLEIDDSVCAEMPEALAEFAPGNQQAVRLGRPCAREKALVASTRLMCYGKKKALRFVQATAELMRIG